jgi:hypothetical protein
MNSGEQNKTPVSNIVSTVNTVKNTVSYSSRFTDPIPSFPGKAPTASEMKMIEAIKAMIERDIAKGTL